MILLWIILLYRTVGNTWQNSKGVLGLLGECVISLVLSCCNKILKEWTSVTAWLQLSLNSGPVFEWVWSNCYSHVLLVSTLEITLQCLIKLNFLLLSDPLILFLSINIYKDNENVHSLYNAYTNIHNSFIHINPNWKEYKSSYQVSE